MMRRRVVFAIALAWIVSLVAVGLWAQSQAPGRTVIEGPGFAPPPMVILSGQDIGFQTRLPVLQRPGQGAKYLLGALMVRVNGEWVYAEIWPGSYGYPIGEPR